MRDTDYAYAVARIRANELRLLTKADLDSLISARTIKDALRALGDKGWENDNINENNFESMLSKEQEKTWILIKESAPDPFMFNMLLYKNDFHNLKVAIKSALLQKDFPQYYLHPNTIDIDEIINNIKEKKFDKLPELLKDTAKEAYEVLMQTGDGQLCDIIIDKAALESIIKAVKDSNDEFLKGLAELMCATADIKAAYRACKTKKNLAFIKRTLAACDTLDIDDMAKAAVAGEHDFIEYISHTKYSDAAQLLSSSTSAFEKWCDDEIIKYIQSAKMTAFGISPLIAYILAREMEIKAVRIILSGKHNNLPQETIRERLRETYV